MTSEEISYFASFWRGSQEGPLRSPLTSLLLDLKDVRLYMMTHSSSGPLADTNLLTIIYRDTLTWDPYQDFTLLPLPTVLYTLPGDLQKLMKCTCQVKKGVLMGVQGQETQRGTRANTCSVPRISAQEWGRRKLLSKTAAGYLAPCFVVFLF